MPRATRGVMRDSSAAGDFGWLLAVSSYCYLCIISGDTAITSLLPLSGYNPLSFFPVAGCEYILLYLHHLHPSDWRLHVPICP
jgi:hypothetical protein